MGKLILEISKKFDKIIKLKEKYDFVKNSSKT